MSLFDIDINLLPIKPAEIDTAACLKYLQKLSNLSIDKAGAEHLLNHIAAIIAKETTDATDNNISCVNQVVLNLSFRCYYQLVHKHKLEDVNFSGLPAQLVPANETAFLMLYAILLTEHWRHLDAVQLEELCTNALIQAVELNASSMLSILKALNLLVKKCTNLNVLQLELTHFHHCLQTGQVGMREEALTLFNHCCKQEKRAYKYFQLLVEYWPWTNRNKYYLLSSILNTHNLLEFLSRSNHSKEEFYAGLRLSLSYKCLLAASQYLVKSLSAQNALELLHLSVELLTNGTLAELHNYYAHWYARIKQQDELFRLLLQKPEIEELLEQQSRLMDGSQQQRFLLVFIMCAKQLFAYSKLYYFKLSTELLTNCYNYETDAQLLIFKFLVDNLGNFAIEDCLEFLYAFMQRHCGVESAQFRNVMLGKLPTIINHIAKHFCRAMNSDSTTLAESIRHYFEHLQQMIMTNLQTDVYQPKIFGLKLFEIIYNSLYAEQVAKNAKNCSTTQNQQLGRYLCAQGIYDAQLMSAQLSALLVDAQGYDDVQELAVILLRQLNTSNEDEATQLCLEYCARSDVDECILSTLHAQVAVGSYKTDKAVNALYAQCLKLLQDNFALYKSDPLDNAKQGKQLFGYLCVINVLVRERDLLLTADYCELLCLIEQVLNNVLDMLNLANIRKSQSSTVASFQDMDESLQLLVQESAYIKRVTAEEDYRKYLLMGFWLTLKACCELATSIGCALMKHFTETQLPALKQCLDVNVAVLTRCRHKGAIEAAGVSIGQLTKCITSKDIPNSDACIAMLVECLTRELLAGDKQVSTTRRGAGFSIMFLHIIKHDEPRRRPLLKHAMHLIFKYLKSSAPNTSITENQDSLDALTLHYLCVLVKDTELRTAISQYYNEIMMAAILQIDNPEWTVCNAALQLFGALVPKLVGQRQATEFESPLVWEPSNLSYGELVRLLPNTCTHILDYCSERTAKTRAIILFLGFLDKVEHLYMNDSTSEKCDFLLRFRLLSWQLLSHRCEQVRKLAAICFARAHEFRRDLCIATVGIVQVLQIGTRNENFFQGLIFALNACVLKLQHETRHVWTSKKLKDFLTCVHLGLTPAINENLNFYTYYTLNKVFGLLKLLASYGESEALDKLIKIEARGHIGESLWREQLNLLSISKNEKNFT